MCNNKLLLLPSKNNKGKLTHAQGPSPFILSTPASTSHPTTTPSTPSPMPRMGSVMVPTWRKVKLQVFELLVFPKAPQPVVYGKGKGPYGAALVS